jgi:hypothetical protein
MKAPKTAYQADLQRRSRTERLIRDYLRMPPQAQRQTRLWLATRSPIFQAEWAHVEANLRATIEAERLAKAATMQTKRKARLSEAVAAGEEWAIEWLKVIDTNPFVRLPAPTMTDAIRQLVAHYAALKLREHPVRSGRPPRPAIDPRDWNSPKRRQARALAALKQAFDKLKI